jgi:dihydroorotase
MKIEIINGKRLEFLGDDIGNAHWCRFDSMEITDGVITSIDPVGSVFNADMTIDADQSYVLPGLIDLSVSLREPGYTTKGSIATETQAAAAGGVTTICCSPDTDPINDSEAVTKFIHELAQKSGKCQVLPLGALTQGLKGEQLAEFSALKSARCVALSNDYHPIKNLAITKRCFEYAKTHELSVFMNPIESSLHQGVMHEGVVSTTIGLPGISTLAETVAVSQLLMLAEATGVHLHLSQLSAADSVRQVKEAKASGIHVTADVAIQNLLYTDEKIENFSSVYHCLPPLRSETDRAALLEGVDSGVIDAITSAHRPHEAAAKQMPFAETEAGMSSIEFLLPMAMKLQAQGGLSLVTLIDTMTRGASKVLNQPASSVSVGQEANLCIFDASQCQVLEYGDIVSQGKNTPLIGEMLTGRVMATIFKGKLSYENTHY